MALKEMVAGKSDLSRGQPATAQMLPKESEKPEVAVAVNRKLSRTQELLKPTEPKSKMPISPKGYSSLPRLKISNLSLKASSSEPSLVNSSSEESVTSDKGTLLKPQTSVPAASIGLCGRSNLAKGKSSSGGSLSLQPKTHFGFKPE